MAQQYGVRHSLCNLDAVKPLLSILSMKNKSDLWGKAADVLLNIAHLKKGRQLIRINEGIEIIVRMHIAELHLFNLII